MVLAYEAFLLCLLIVLIADATAFLFQLNGSLAKDVVVTVTLRNRPLGASLARSPPERFTKLANTLSYRIISTIKSSLRRESGVSFDSLRGSLTSKLPSLCAVHSEEARHGWNYILTH